MLPCVMVLKKEEKEQISRRNMFKTYKNAFALFWFLFFSFFIFLFVFWSKEGLLGDKTLSQDGWMFLEGERKKTGKPKRSLTV